MEAKTLLEVVEADLLKRNVFTLDVDVDTEYLRLPANLQEQTDSEIRSRMYAFAQQRAVTRKVRDDLKVQEFEANQAYRKASRDLYIQMERLSETSKNMLLETNADLRPLFLRWQKLKQEREVCDSILEGYTELVTVLSRELTCRGLDTKVDMFISK